MRFLCVSDIHGNARALKAVLKAAEGRGFNKLVVCGDMLFPGDAPMETWKTLLDEQAVCAQGASDRALAILHPESLEPKTPEQVARVERLEALHHELGELILARLRRLPPVVRLPLESGHEMIVVHGSPMDPLEPLSHEMTDEELNALIGDDPADFIICGGSHVPFDRFVGDQRILNVGSVGESPNPGFADATLIETSLTDFTVDQFVVEI